MNASGLKIPGTEEKAGGTAVWVLWREKQGAGWSEKTYSGLLVTSSCHPHLPRSMYKFLVADLPEGLRVVPFDQSGEKIRLEECCIDVNADVKVPIRFINMCMLAKSVDDQLQQLDPFFREVIMASRDPE